MNSIELSTTSLQGQPPPTPAPSIEQQELTNNLAKKPLLDGDSNEENIQKSIEKPIRKGTTKRQKSQEIDETTSFLQQNKLDINNVNKELKLERTQKLDRSEQSEDNHKELYIELEELEFNENYAFYNSTTSEVSNYKWKIVSRWIKYEQTIDPITNIWSKPFIGAVVYQNLVYLKNTLQYGTIILNSGQNSFENMIEEVLKDFIDRGHVNRDYKDKLKAIILCQHREHVTIAGTLSAKKAPIAELYSSNCKHFELSGNHSFIGDYFGSRMIRKENSFLKQNSKIDEEAHKSDLNFHEKKTNPVSFYVPSLASESHSNININEKLNQHQAHHHTHHKHLKSSLNLFKNTFHHSKSSKSELMMSGAVEAFLIMVGEVDFLDRPIMAFVRLQNEQFVDHLLEFQIKVKFLFIFLGPKRDNIDYHEIGRCMGTLMTNREFHNCVYNAKTRQELIRGITAFTNRSLCLVLPLCDFDDDLFHPVTEWVKKKMDLKMNKRKNKQKNEQKVHQQLALDNKPADLPTKDSKKEKEEQFNPFKRTGCLFGALAGEVKHRYSQYFSDIRDGLNLHCLISFFFIFTVCVAPALCFGGILAEKTNNWFGLNEMLLATASNGIFFSLFSGQPLMIFGATGPFLVFEEMLYKVAVWILFFILILLAFEGVFIVHYVTRFTEEIFAFLIACVFLADAFKKVYYFFDQNPIYTSEVYCDLINKNSSTEPFFLANYKAHSVWNETKNMQKTSSFKQHEPNIKNNHSKPEANIALISLLLLVGTCAVALFLKKLRRSKFFGAYVRRTLSDVGILISIVLMVLVDLLIRIKTDINTQKLDIPESLTPTNYEIRKTWFVSPLGNNYHDNRSFHIWVPFFAILPAFVIFIVLFFEIELTGIILSSKIRKLKKGSGFNLDLLLAGIMLTFNSFFGLPWLCAAPVGTIAHWASLSIYSSSLIPGEKPKLVDVKEQRVTNLLVHIAIALCLKFREFLQIIPVPVLFGIFLYFGIVSLSGTQLFERIKLVFIPYKYCPNVSYAIGIRPSKRNIFTLIQLIAVVVLMGFKSYANLSFVFPLLLILLVLFRKFILGKFFNHRELEQLDDENEHDDDDTIHDFYELTHLPV